MIQNSSLATMKNSRLVSWHILFLSQLGRDKYFC